MDQPNRFGDVADDKAFSYHVYGPKFDLNTERKIDKIP